MELVRKRLTLLPSGEIPTLPVDITTSKEELMAGTTLALFVLFIPNSASACQQEEKSPAHAIGKRIELKVKNRHGEGEYICTGIVTQVDQKRVILEDVTRTRFINTGVPVLSKIPHTNKLFKNVGAEQMIELDYGIVLKLDQIKSWRIAKSKVHDEKRD